MQNLIKNLPYLEKRLFLRIPLLQVLQSLTALQALEMKRSMIVPVLPALKSLTASQVLEILRSRVALGLNQYMSATFQHGVILTL